METNTALSLVGYGLFVGATIAFLFNFLIFRRREKQLKKTLNEEKSVIITILDSTNKQLGKESHHANDLEYKVEQQAKKLSELEIDKTRIETRIEAERESGEKLVTSLLESQETLKAAVEALSNKVQVESIPAFVEYTDSKHKSISELVAPVEKHLEELWEFVREVEKNGNSGFLNSQIQVRQIFEAIAQTARMIEELMGSPEQLERYLEKLDDDFDEEFGNLRIVEPLERKKAG